MSSVAATPHVDYDLLAPEHLRDPYPLYAELRALARVHWSDSLAGWVLTRHDDVRAGLNDRELSAARFAPYLERLAARPDADPGDLRLFEGLSRWFTFADPPGHTRLRGVTRRVLSPPMKAMSGWVERMVERLLDRFDADGGGDVVTGLARPLSVGAIAELLGVAPGDVDRFTEWSDVLTGFIGGALGVADRRRRALEGLEGLDAYLRELIAARRKSPTEDLIGRLAAIEGDAALTDEEIAAIGAMMLFAGHGTTTNLVGNGMLALLRHPAQIDLLRRAPDRAPAAVEELLRYDSPVQVNVRNALRDGALGEPAVCRGDRVFLVIGAANRDAALHERSEELDIERSDPRHLSFGYGIHFCLGAPLARIEAPAAIGRLVARFPRLRLAVDEADLAWQPTVGFRGLERLPVAVGEP